MSVPDVSRASDTASNFQVSPNDLFVVHLLRHLLLVAQYVRKAAETVSGFLTTFLGANGTGW